MGALMLSLPVTHPDIMEFITAKNDLNRLTKANISVMLNDEFMQAVKLNQDWLMHYKVKDTGEVIEKTLPAREIMHKIAKSAYDTGEPGILNWDRVQNWHINSENPKFKYTSTNPCMTGDTKILTIKGYQRIDTLVNKKVNIWNGYEFSEVVPIETGQNQDILDITFSNGMSVSCTPYHKFILQDGKRIEAEKLKVGDNLAKWNYPVIETTIDKKVKDKEMYTRGFLSGDGTISQGHRKRSIIYLYKAKKHLKDYIDYKEYYDVKNSDRFDLELDHNMYDSKEFVPGVEYSIKERLNWLAGLIDSDGTRNDIGGSVGISSIHLNFLKNVQLMINTLGCHSSVNLDRKECQKSMPDGNGRQKKYHCKNSYRLIISSFNVDKLIKLGLKTHRVKLLGKPNRDASHFIKVTSITKRNEKADHVYCFTENKNHSGIFNGIMAAQCGEKPLPAGGSCMLGSINLSEYVINPFADNSQFDFQSFEQDVKDVVIYMNEVLDEGIKYLPLEEQKETAKKYRQLGIGVMGLADMLIKMKLRYGSDLSKHFLHLIFECMINATLEQSALLAKEYGTYEAYNKETVLKSPFLHTVARKDIYDLIKKYGLRNAELLSIAPTGSISTMLGVSGGCEPIFQFSYTRKTESLIDNENGTYYKVYTPIVKQYMEKFGIKDEKDLPDYFVTAMDIYYKERIEMQSIMQTYVDSAISSTINLPEKTTVEDIEDLYMYAWEKGLKGITVFRNNCKRSGILITDKENKKNRLEKIEELQQQISQLAIEELKDNPDVCPMCGGKLIHNGGCVECPDCGYSPCSI